MFCFPHHGFRDNRHVLLEADGRFFLTNRMDSKGNIQCVSAQTEWFKFLFSQVININSVILFPKSSIIQKDDVFVPAFVRQTETALFGRGQICVCSVEWQNCGEKCKKAHGGTCFYTQHYEQSFCYDTVYLHYQLY